MDENTLLDPKAVERARDRPRLSDVAFQVIRDAIVSGRIKPGERLRQETLARELDMSQVTVREALNRLIGEGLAVRVPYKGVRAIALSAQDLEDIWAMRGLLEGLAAELAAERMTTEELEQMRELLPSTIVDATPESVGRAREANRKFHEIVIRASRRRFLIRVLGQIWDWMDPLMLYGRTLTAGHGEETRTKWGERDRLRHSQLLDALEARDGPRARQLVVEMVQEAWANLAEVLDSSDLNEELSPE